MLMVSNLPDPLWLISIASFVPLLPFNRLVRDLNKATHHEVQWDDRFSVKSWIVMACGLLLWLLLLAALFTTEA